jgi:hypothetical protein
VVVVVIENVRFERVGESVVILPLRDFGELDVESYLFRRERLGLYILAGSFLLISTLFWHRNRCCYGGKLVFLFLSVLLFQFNLCFEFSLFLPSLLRHDALFWRGLHLGFEVLAIDSHFS